MKQIILTFIFLILIIKVVSAQEYRPFPDSNAIWKVTYVDVVPPPPWGYTHYYHYIIDGDTLVNELIYQNIYKIDYNYFCTEIILDTQYAGSIRDNELEKRVYFLPPYTEQDTLLYDFSLEVGDTLPASYTNVIYPNLYVESIDSILINNHFNKRFMLEAEYHPPGLSLIEGVGSITGLLEDMYWFEMNGSLRCFELNDTLNTLRGSDTSYCILPTDTCYMVDINEKYHLKISHKIYPNPSSTDNIHIEIAEQDLPVVLEVYDIIGQLMFKNILHNKISDVELKELDNGVYIIILRNKWSFATTKIIFN